MGTKVETIIPLESLKNYKFFPIQFKLDFIDFFMTKLSPTNLWLSNVTKNMSMELWIGRTNTYIYKLNFLNQGY